MTSLAPLLSPLTSLRARLAARAALLLALLALAGCPKGKKGGAGHAANGSCDVTLSGAQTGTFKCGGQDSPTDGPLLTYAIAKNQTNVNIAFNSPGDGPDYLGGLGFTGKPVVGTTYSLASPGADGQATMHRSEQRWTASSKRPNEPLAGAITVTFTTLDGASDLAGSTVWSTIHGTIVATMPGAGGGATGSVSVTAKF